MVITLKKTGKEWDSLKNKQCTKLVFLLLLFVFLTQFISKVSFGVNAQPSNDYKGISYCVECHKIEFEEWSESPHTQGFSNPEFQEVWGKIGTPEDCLKCHVTGYDENSKEYSVTEVTCEECHGPGDTMKRDTSVELCGKCHSGPYPTYEEWRDSGPSHGEANCILCHDKHSAELTFSTSTGTCNQCHDFHVEEVLDTAHGDSGVECSECHMVSEKADFITGKPGNTGHSFVLNEDELDCSSCHERKLSKHDVLGEKAFACLSCHGAIHELELELVNRNIYSLDDSVPLCAQCHNERYTDWAQGTHGSVEDPRASCVECHDPHEPVISGISTLPFIPPRTPAKPVSIPLAIAVVVIIELLVFSIYILRRQTNV
jgi:hypothetical protein